MPEDAPALGINAGEVRRDLTVSDVHLLATCAPSGAAPAGIERWIELVLPSIRAVAAGG